MDELVERRKMMYDNITMSPEEKRVQYGKYVLGLIAIGFLLKAVMLLQQIADK